MAQPILALSDDYATIDLSNVASTASVYARVLEYAPRPPDDDTTFAPGGVFGGERLIASRSRNVIESARVLVYGTTIQGIRDWIQSVEDFFSRAKIFQVRQIGNNIPRVTFKGDGVGDVAYSSPCISGRVDLPGESLNIGWRNKAIEVLLTWTRGPYWEGAFTWASLRNPQATVLSNVSTGFITVHNSQDASKWNAVDILNVAGTIPTPLYVEVLNNSASALGAFWLSTWNGDGDVTLFPHAKEAEGNAGMTTVANAAFSAGAYGTTASFPANGESIMFAVPLDANAATAAAGRFFRVLMNVANGSQFPAGTRYRLALIQHGEYVWFGPYMQTPDTLNPGGPGDSLIDWGVIQLPASFTGPWGGSTSVVPAPLSVQFRIVPTTTRSFNVDFVNFLPTDTIKEYAPTNVTGLANGDSLIDDGPAGSVYNLKPPDGGTVQTRVIQGNGGSLMAYPGQYLKNRLFFAGMGVDRFASPARTVSLRVGYSPRRLTI